MASGISSFLDHQKVILDLSNDLRELRKHAFDLGLEGSAGEIAGVLARMESDKFSVVVVGEFKRGKSTFINALLGVNVLPADVLPTTATLNRVTYGYDKRAVVDYYDGRRDTIPFDALPDYVTKLSDESEKVAALIKEATVYYPSAYCQNNVDVIDTPGLNDDDSMTAVTLTVLPRADAAIMVVMAQAPFGDYERSFLEERLLTADLGRIIFVVNGLDRLNNPQDAPRVVAGIEKRIQSNVMDRAKRQFGEDSPDYNLYLRKIGKPRVFGLSAFEALEAKKSGDMARLAGSGFPEFEAKLQKFLVEQRGVIMLQVPLNRCITASRDVLEALSVSLAAQSLKADEFERACQASENEIRILRDAWGQEKKSLDESERALRTAAEKLATEYVKDYKATGLAAIESVPVTAEDIADKAAKARLNARIGKVLESAKSRVLDDYTSKFDSLVGASLLAEGQRLSQWSGRVQRLMPAIRRHFTGQSQEPTTEAQIAANVIDGISFLVPGLAGALGGYRTAGIKGIATGVAGGLLGSALVMGAAVAASSIIALPLMPVFLAMGAGAYVGGKLLSRVVFESSRIEGHVEEFKRKFLKQVDSEMPEEQVRLGFEQAAADLFGLFREQVTQRSEAALADGMNLIATRRSEVARDQASLASERDRLLGVQREIENIAVRARRLSEQLLQSTEV